MGCLQNWLNPLIRERKIAFSYGCQLFAIGFLNLGKAIEISVLNGVAEKSATCMGLAEN
ncbi:hypothetical protein [Apilactobacillus timberlakei]|uniref:hypothetical protein n=1 Tax=Apilactobacillus timberlakei TaxID=2008380 RepID=UPI0013000B9F|nr:hypothetical protein [Apilactobacillus timberlakei]